MFVTKKYIYPGKKKNLVEINGVLVNPFLLNLDNPKIFYKDAYFYDYDFSFLGDFLYFDESIANVNGKIFEHNLLMIDERKRLFNDIDIIKDFFNKYLTKNMTLITFEDLSELGLKSITPIEAIELKEKLKNIFIQNNKKWVHIDELKDKFVYVDKFSIKIDKKETFSVEKKGIYKFRFKQNGRFFEIFNLKIDLLKLIKV